MYLARITKQGAERQGLVEGAVVQYDTIHPLNKCIDGFVIDGERHNGLLSFVYNDRSVELITWPDDLDYQEVK
jgi:hypothetical protein